MSGIGSYAVLRRRNFAAWNTQGIDGALQNSGTLFTFRKIRMMVAYARGTCARVTARLRLSLPVPAASSVRR